MSTGAKAGELYWEMTANTAGVKSGTKEAERVVESSAKNIAQRLREAELEARKSGEFAIDRMLNSPGGLAQGVLKLAGIGLEGIIVDRVGAALKDASEHAVELRKHMVEAASSADGMGMDLRNIANETMKAIPILGDYVTAFENIREALTGEKLEIELINKEAQLTTKHFIDQGAAANNLRNILRGNTQEIERSLALQQQAQTRDPFEKRMIGMRDAGAAQLEGDQAALEEKRNKTKADNDKLIADAEEDAKNARAKFANKFGGLPQDKQGILDNTSDPAFDNSSSNAFGFDDSGVSGSKAPSQRKEALAALAEIEAAEAAVQAANKKAAADKLKIEDDAAKIMAQHKATNAAQIEDAQIQETERKMVENRAIERRKIDESQAFDKEQAEIDRGARQAESIERQIDLGNQGKMLEARLEQIRSNYDERIRLAKSTKEKEALIRAESGEEEKARSDDLAKSEQIDRRGMSGGIDRDRGHQVSFSGLSEMWSNIQSSISNGDDGSKATAANTRQLVRLQQKTNEHLETIAANSSKPRLAVMGP